MRATDQLSAMEMMAVDPMRHVIAPRFIAGVIAAPLLTAIFCVMALGVAGGHAIGVELLGVDAGSYWSQIRANVALHAPLPSLLKSTVFGAVIRWIAVYPGSTPPPPPAGVPPPT